MRHLTEILHNQKEMMFIMIIIHIDVRIKIRRIHYDFEIIRKMKGKNGNIAHSQGPSHIITDNNR